MNATSSRSHCLYRLIIESTQEAGVEGKPIKKLSYLNLVDLAGSERQQSTGAEGTRLKEGANINKSLLALGSVIQKVWEGWAPTNTTV